MLCIRARFLPPWLCDCVALPTPARPTPEGERDLRFLMSCELLSDAGLPNCRLFGRYRPRPWPRPWPRPPAERRSSVLLALLLDFCFTFAAYDSLFGAILSGSSNRRSFPFCCRRSGLSSSPAATFCSSFAMSVSQRDSLTVRAFSEAEASPEASARAAA